MPAGVLPEARRHTIPLTDQGAEGGRVLEVPLAGPIVVPRRQIVLPNEHLGFLREKSGGPTPCPH